MYLSDSADDAQETRSEKVFVELEPGFRGDRFLERLSSRFEDRHRDGVAASAA